MAEIMIGANGAAKRWLLATQTTPHRSLNMIAMDGFCKNMPGSFVWTHSLTKNNNNGRKGKGVTQALFIILLTSVWMWNIILFQVVLFLFLTLTKNGTISTINSIELTHIFFILSVKQHWPHLFTEWHYLQYCNCKSLLRSYHHDYIIPPSGG